MQEKPWGTRYRIRAYPVDSHQKFRFTLDLIIRSRTALIKRDVECCTLAPDQGIGGL
mgnify:CR=1 FL=1